MDSLRDRLHILQSVDPSASHVRRIVASYDGCYQMRSGKAGGGFSRYCFASAIAVDTAQVISYGIGCNSCHICTLYENKLKSNSTSAADYDTFIEKHQKTCQANYSHLSSVQLEIEHVFLFKNLLVIRVTRIYSDSCAICGGTQDDCIVGFGIGFCDEVIDWILCNICDLWYHVKCLGLNIEDVQDLPEWNCLDCT